MLLTVIVAIYAVLVPAFIICGTCYFVLGERVLRLFRSRYPDQWKRRGEPTFISFAILGERWWRPISASNFFGYREYLTLGDAELTHRGDVVRALGRVTFAMPVGCVMLAFIAIKFA